MYLLYADEFGHDGVWDPKDPKRRHHPLFGLAGVAVQASRWRDLDRGYHRLKQHFYKPEIWLKGKRSERFEAKELSLGSRRDVRFTHAVFTLLKRVGTVLFAYGIHKTPGADQNGESLYGTVTQGLMQAYERYIRQQHGKHTKGLIVLDRRNETRDLELLAWSQSHLFSASDVFRGGFDRLVETPMLVRSEWHHGIQAVDNVARVLGRVYRYRVLGDMYKAYDTEFGNELDALMHEIPPNWRSIYISGAPRTSVDRPLPGWSVSAGPLSLPSKPTGTQGPDSN